MNARRFVALGLAFLGCMAAVPAAAAATPGSAIARWALFEGALTHPAPPADALRGVELRTEFTAPDGQVTRFWGYYDGGATWRFRFSPDQVGRWRYAARFSDDAAEVSGEFACTTSDLPGPLTRWRENPTWFATAAGGPVVVRSFHVGDRFFAENLEAGTRTRFLDWAQAQGYNLLSIASHYLNRNAPGRGQGWRTPRLWDAGTRSVQPGEYAKAEAILDELGARHFYVHPFAGFIGRHSEFPVDPADQELYVRYTLARFAPYWNVLLNVAGPEPLWKPEGYENRMSFAEVNRIGEMIQRLDPFGRLLSVHNASGDDPFRFSSWASYSTLQGGPAEKGDDLPALHNFLFRNHTGDRPIYAHEVLWPGNSLHARADGRPAAAQGARDALRGRRHQLRRHERRLLHGLQRHPRPRRAPPREARGREIRLGLLREGPLRPPAADVGRGEEGRVPGGRRPRVLGLPGAGRGHGARLRATRRLARRMAVPGGPRRARSRAGRGTEVLCRTGRFHQRRRPAPVARMIGGFPMRLPRLAALILASATSPAPPTRPPRRPAP